MSVNGSWSGMMGQVVSGTAEIAASAFYYTKERVEVVAYSDPLGTVT
jgi:ABC-type amino acid transport substrate-binding protein